MKQMPRFACRSAAALGLLACLAAAGCVASTAGNPKASPAAVALTRQVAAHQEAQVYARFTPALQKALPAPQLARLWAGLEEHFGAFDNASVADNRKADAAGQTNVTVACQFAHGTEFLVWTLQDSDLRVAGLHLGGGA